MKQEPNWTQGQLECFEEYEVSVDAESNIENQLAGWHVIGVPERGNGEMFVVLHFHGTDQEEYDANSDRLIACWNALANIPDPLAFVEAARVLQAAAQEQLTYMDICNDKGDLERNLRAALAAFRTATGAA